MNKTNILTILFVSLFFISCASTEDSKFERVEVGKYYRPSGMVKYFLPDVPNWNNSSYEANCKRSTSVKYLHLENIMKSFAISYEDAVQVQYLYNIDYMKASEKKGGSPSLKEEEAIFFLALDKIKAGQKVFKKPVFKRVNIVWVDSILKSNPNQLRELLVKPSFMQGRPLLISMCSTRKELFSKLRRLNIPFEGSRFITYEMFTFFNKIGEQGARELLDLTQFLSTKQNLFFYYNGKRPRNILGRFKYINLK
jgi:hypothetical protein